MRRAVASTRTPRVLGDLGGFAGLVSAGGYRDPVLVAGTDGVGTKLLLQREAGRLRDSGIDLVGMCVNDVLTCGAEPALFLDYIAVGRLDPERVADVVEGVADGCREAGCALLGGETAELPDMYGADDLDLAGFALGIVERDAHHRRLARVAAGDAVIGLAASGRALQRLHARAPAAGARRARARRRARRPARAHAHLRARGRARCARPATCAPWRTSRAAACPAISRASCPRASARASTSGAGRRPPSSSWLAGLGVERDEMRRVFNGGLGYVAVVPRGRGRGGDRGLRGAPAARPGRSARSCRARASSTRRSV